MKRKLIALYVAASGVRPMGNGPFDDDFGQAAGAKKEGSDPSPSRS